jgi:hypothetical protein
MNLSSKLASVLLAGMAFATTGQAFADASIPASESISAFREMNQSFRSLYYLQNPQVDAQVPLIVVIRSETISVIEPNKPATPTTYTLAPRIEEIKSALHATLAFQGLMAVVATDPSEARWAQVAQFHAQLAKLDGMVAGSSADAVTRSATLVALRQLQAGTKAALDRRVVTDQQVVDVLRAARPYIMQAVNQIGEASLEQMIAVLRSIKEQVSTDVWDKAVVVVPGPAVARIDNLAVMAGMQVLGSQELGRRIFYSEGVYDDQGIAAYVQVLMRDKRFSGMLFDDPYRMWRDVFADTSRRYIDRDYFTPLAQQP